MKTLTTIRILSGVFCLLVMTQNFAHHVLGRPAYSLNEDSNTPPAKQVELYAGDYNISYTVFPAFPKPQQSGRINFHAANIDTDKSFIGEVTFKVRDDSWFSTKAEILGVQQHDDFIYHQEFVFSNEGNYIVTVEFQANGEPYEIDFPLQVGSPLTMGTIGAYVALALLILLVSTTLNQKRLQSIRTKRHYLDIKGIEVELNE